MNDVPGATSEGNPMPGVSGSENLAALLLRARALSAPSRLGLVASLDRYEIVSVLGQGGMGVVLLANDPTADAKVAIKMLRPELAREPHVVRQFLAEARHMRRLDHGRILPVLEVCDRSAGPYYVMPYRKRGSLALLIKPGEPLGPDLTLRIARDVAEALSHAHAHGVIHRDVKPMNVLLDADDRACLADFGLVRAFDRNESIYEPDREGRVGTAAYMSPAIVRNEAEDTRCDIYAFGAMLYEMLTGQAPYTGSSREAILAQILAGPPVPIRTRNPKARTGLVAIAEGCMGRELRDRYASMNDVLADLGRVEGGHSPLGPRGQVRRQASIPTRTYLLVGIAGLLIAGAWAARRTWTQRSDRPTPTASAPAASHGIAPSFVEPTSESGMAAATGIAGDGSELRNLLALWPIALHEDLTSDSCLERAYLSFPITYSSHGPTFEVIPGKGLKIGWGMSNVAWLNGLVADEYVVTVDFKPLVIDSAEKNVGTGIWLNGPGYGISSRLGCRFWIAADGQGYVLTDQGPAWPRVTGRLDRPLDPDAWHRAELLRRGDRLAVWLDGSLLFDRRIVVPCDPYLNSYVGIGGGSGWYSGPNWHAERTKDPVFRSITIRMPQAQARRLAALPVERQFDGRTDTPSKANGSLLFSHDFLKDGLGPWFVACDAEYARLDPEGMIFTEWGRSPLLWYSEPLRGDCAVEVEVRFLPKLAPHGLFLFLATEDPRAAKDSNYHGWCLGLPASSSENVMSWLSAGNDVVGRVWSDASRPRVNIAQEPCFVPVPGRDSVFRLERTGNQLRVFANRRCLMEGDAPQGSNPASDLYLGVGKGFGPKVIRSVRAWRLNQAPSRPDSAAP